MDMIWISCGKGCCGEGKLKGIASRGDGNGVHKGYGGCKWEARQVYCIIITSMGTGRMPLMEYRMSPL